MVMKRTALIAVAALALTACGSSAAPRSTSAASSVPVVTAAPAQPVTASASAMNDWCDSAGYIDYQNVQSDLTGVSTDIGNGDYGTAENADATQLNADAEAAEADSPPVAKSRKVDYILYMGAISFAAADLSSGSISAAEKAMKVAAGYGEKVSAMVAVCG